MKQYMMRYEIKNKAKDKLMGKYSILILGSFLFSLMNAAVLFIFAFPYITSVMASVAEVIREEDGAQIQAVEHRVGEEDARSRGS